MKRVLSFSIFDHYRDFQFLFYLRGLWFNVAMASIVYPGFEVWIYAEKSIYVKYQELFKYLTSKYGCTVIVKQDQNLCLNMLWKMEPIFDESVEYCFCRDSDALVTFREMVNVADFIKSGDIIQGIHDNPAHSLPLLGGLSGFRCRLIKEKYKSLGQLINSSGIKINQHGTDQQLLNSFVYPDFIDEYFDKEPCKTKDGSDLCVSFIGAAGCNEMETLRYLRSQGIDLSLGGIGWLYPSVFYWLADKGPAHIPGSFQTESLKQ